MKMTIKDATKEWVKQFNAIPVSLLDKAYESVEEVYEMELTPPPVKYECEDCQEEFDECYYDDSDNYDEENGYVKCSSCDGQILTEDDYDNRPYGFPMWGTVWSFSESLDEHWAKENLQEIANCGFRIYESDDLGVFIGIDGGGYDFYEQHWIPLYKARGLRWHDIEE